MSLVVYLNSVNSTKFDQPINTHARPRVSPGQSGSRVTGVPGRVTGQCRWPGSISGVWYYVGLL